jgi:hypothetical protein
MFPIESGCRDGIIRSNFLIERQKDFLSIYEMDKEQQIQELLKLIASATGDNRKLLVKRLEDLLNDETDRNKKHQRRKKVQNLAQRTKLQKKIKK